MTAENSRGGREPLAAFAELSKIVVGEGFLCCSASTCLP
jgi:hypothetical protein